ncbi:MAG: transcriptional regulator [Acidimicrobiia bacterium]|nr:MAG: transcriptional regulator [Acidimicrobiia bacterium]
MRAPSRTVPRPRLDEVDKALIRLLQEDGRMSYAELASTVGLSPAAVRQRVLRLVRDGVMQIVAVTDPISLGFDIQAMVGLRIEGDLEQVSSKLSAIEEVDYLVITTGRFDLLAEIVCESTEHFLDVLNQIRTVDGVVSSEVFSYLRLVKQTYDWGAR